MKKHSLSLIPLMFLGGCLLVACERQEVTVYEVPKEESKTSSPEFLERAPETPPVSWTLPKGWQPGQPSPMRVSSFVVAGAEGETADISITTFPGDVGGALLNINRWRRQIGLGSITADEVESLTTLMEIHGRPCQLVDLEGEIPPSGKESPQRSLVATMSYEGNSWFFKMSGDASLVEAQREAYLEFLKSVRFGDR